MTTLTFTDAELRLLWLAAETIRDANPDDADAIALDAKITSAVPD